MEWAPAEKQQIVWDISVGNPVTPAEVDWAIREGYAVQTVSGPEVTDKGYAFFRRSI